jgi:Xaa-Pro aminopeptidase
VTGRVAELRKLMQHQALDGVLITSLFNRRYLSGFTGSAGFLLITKDQAILLTDFRYGVQAQEQASAFSVIQHKGSILQEVSNQIGQLGLTRIGLEKQQVTYQFYEDLTAMMANVEWSGIDEIMEQLRLVKSPEEIDMIRQACKIADDAFQHILNYIADGVVESDLALELEYFMRKQGATSSSFDIIVASGYRSALPHGVASSKQIRQGEFITFDFGAYYGGYVSDITRTVALGSPSAELKKIYDIVLNAQTYAVSRIKAEMTGKDADALARDLIEQAGYGQNFGHSTGHGIGLEVHEGPRLSSKSDVILQPGMVVTVEPGIYLPNIGGVRIEDDVLITNEGCDVLTHSPKELIIL